MDELVRVYKTIIRPVLDYGAMVYHSPLMDEQDELLERIQSQALSYIYGARSKRQLANIQTAEKKGGSVQEICSEVCCHGSFFGFLPFEEIVSKRKREEQGNLSREECALLET